MHANIIRFALLLLCASIQVSVWGQIREVRNVPTPEVSNLGTFGSVPVGHYTGTPNISVPLYTMKVGKLSIPLQAMYHTANVKPHVPPTCLGIGWALSAGGYISRSVKGCQDEKQTYSTSAGFYDNHNKIEVIEASADKAQKLQQFTHLSGNDWYELSADEFYFYFNGYSGTFFMDKEGKWRVISDDNIKVEFSNGDGFISIDNLKERIQQRYGFRLIGYNENMNKRFFDKFTLITPDGTRYEFGGGNATEYSVPYYNQVEGDVMATCWRLSKITTIDQRVVTFEYAADSYMVDIHFAPQKVIYYQDYQSIGAQKNFGRTGYSGFLMMPSRLIKIRCKDESVCFNYNRDDNYGRLFPHNSKCLYWQDNPNGYFDDNSRYMYGASGILKINRFSLFMGISPSSSEQETRDAIAKKLTQDYLSDITIQRSGSDILKIAFDFETKNNRKLLSCIKFISVEPRTFIDDAPSSLLCGSMGVSVNNDEPKRNGDVVIGESESMYSCQKEYEYKFNYYLDENSDNNWPNRSPLTYTDSWGFYSRDGSNTNNPGEWSLANTNYNFNIRTASSSSTKVFVLKSVRYPTGGKTIFDYELNDYSKVFDLQTLSLNEISGTFICSGGLRVKAMRNYDASDNLLYSKEYAYRNPNGKSSGISKGTPIFYDRIYFNSDKTNFIDFYSFDDINPYPMNFNTPSVGYSTVLETLKDANGHVLTTTEYQYTNYDTDANKQSHKDQWADFTANVYGSYASAAFTSMAFERGKLVCKKVTDGHNLLEKTTYEYNRQPGIPYSTISQEWHLDYNKNLYAFSFFYKTYTNKYLVSVSKREETMDNGKYKSEEHYEYNQYGMLSKKTVVSNNGENHSTSYIYSPDRYGWMEKYHIFVPVEVEERKGKTTAKIQYVYSRLDMIPYISAQHSMWSCGGFETTKTDYTVIKADQYGNPIELNEQGVTTIMIWSHKGQRPIASIQNATYDEVVAALGKTPEEYSVLNTSSLSLENLRTALPKALVYTYMYDNRLNLISKTDPNGLVHLYTYDSLNRLTAERRQYGNKTELLNSYQYNYKTK